MHYYMGVDGGGTKTVCLLSDSNGRIVGRGSAGPSNYHVVGKDKAERALHAVLREAVAQAGLEDPIIKNITLGLAGVDRPDDFAIVNSILDNVGFQFCSRTIDNDAAVALAGATIAQPGVAIISGTGSMVIGINNSGERRRSGGWGPILGDEGGGYDIGRRALIAVMRASDARGSSTMLTSMLLNHFELDRAPSLVHQVYQNMQRHDIADLTRFVIEAAENGDEVAQDILLYAAQELATAAQAVILSLHMQNDKFSIALCGGVFSAPSLLQGRIEQLTKSVAPYSQVVLPHFSPAVGALLLSLKQAELLSEQVLRYIESTKEMSR